MDDEKTCRKNSPDPHEGFTHHITQERTIAFSPPPPENQPYHSSAVMLFPSDWQGFP